jgi:hypothetical protein
VGAKTNLTSGFDTTKHLYSDELLDSGMKYLKTPTQCDWSFFVGVLYVDPCLERRRDDTDELASEIRMPT